MVPVHSMARRGPRSAAGRLGAIAALLSLAACGSGRESGTPAPPAAQSGERAASQSDGEPPVKVLLVAIDGATFDVIDPLLAQGKLPNFERLIERGVRAKLESQKPILSPAVWTTIATGRNREDHAIKGFLSPRSRRDAPALVQSIDRKVPALWNMLSSAGRSVGVIGWWATWPAEPVQGFVVSDRVAHGRWQSWTDGTGSERSTHPEELQRELLPLVVDAVRSPPMDEILALADFSAEEREAISSADHPLPFHGPSVLKFGWCEQRTYENIALHLLARSQPDLALLLLVAVDPVSHTFWHYYQPERFGGSVDPDQAARLGRIVPAVYEHDDATLGKLLELVDERTVVMVVSDHGFTASGRLPGLTREVDYRSVGLRKVEEFEKPVNIGTSGIHHPDGILVACGGPIRRGAVPAGQPSVLDVAPTVLALLGLPIGDNMPGRVLEELIEPSYLARHPIQRIRAWEDRVKPALAGLPSPSEDHTRTELLRSLGYVGFEGEAPEAPADPPRPREK